MPFLLFPMMLSAPIDVPLVRQLFSRPDKIAASDFLRREIAGRMREKLALVKIAPQRVLDAGCGAGSDLVELQKIYPEAQLLGADASYPLLQLARQRRHCALGAVGRLLSRWTALRNEPEQGLLCGDFARLPLAANSVDLIWSNLALHWHPQPDLVFAEWRRALRTEGLLMFSCFGPDTLLELRQAYAAAGQSQPTLAFVDMHDFGDMLVNAGFSTPVMDMEKITLTYDDSARLLADVRALGGNPLLTRQRGLRGRRAHQALLQALESRRNPEGKITLTLEVVYGHAFRPVARKTAAGEAIIRFDLPKKGV
ncbi:MAG: methyltransferase domain-containing protein [Burkholderiales bacterium]|nr:methyltransferase domain-containing protein [Burkholderiales bacterium]